LFFAGPPLGRYVVENNRHGYIIERVLMATDGSFDRKSFGVFIQTAEFHGLNPNGIYMEKKLGITIDPYAAAAMVVTLRTRGK